MCLYNMQKKRIELHNESLGKMLGIYTNHCMKIIESAVLRPKKKKITFDDQDLNLMGKYFHDVQIDKSQKTLNQVIIEVLNHNYRRNQASSTEADCLHRYNIVKTNKNVVIEARQFNLDNCEYSVIFFTEINAIQNFENAKQKRRFDQQYTTCLNNDLLGPIQKI